MINYFREINKTFCYIVFVLIASSFAFFGLGGLLSGNSSVKNTEVNGKPISQDALKQQTQTLIYEYYKQYKQRPTQAVVAQLQQEALTSLVRYQVGLDVAHHLGFSIHANTVNALITQLSAFTDHGVFSRDKLTQCLATTNMSESDLYYQYYQSLLSEQQSRIFSLTAFTTEKEQAQLSRLTTRTMTLQPFRIDTSNVPIQTVTEADISLYYDQHKHEFQNKARGKTNLD